MSETITSVKVKALGEAQSASYNDRLIIDTGSGSNFTTKKITVGNLLNGYSKTDHNHDDSYYTKDEVNKRLSDMESDCERSYSASGHTHDDRYYTENEADGKFASIVHNHDEYSKNDHGHNGVYYRKEEVDAKIDCGFPGNTQHELEGLGPHIADSDIWVMVTVDIKASGYVKIRDLTNGFEVSREVSDLTTAAVETLILPVRKGHKFQIFHSTCDSIKTYYYGASSNS